MSGNNELISRTTDCQTMMHILKANIGTGVLAMPLAFRHVGLWVGLCLVPIIGAICIHCMNILLASHNRICDSFNYESLDYDQVAALSLACGPKPARRMAKWASCIVTVFLMSTQIGFCCVYTLFAVENIQLAMLNLFNLNYSISTYLIIVFPIIGLASCTSNLEHLARISTFGNVLQLTGLALIFYDLLQFHTYAETSQTPSSATVALNYANSFQNNSSNLNSTTTTTLPSSSSSSSGTSAQQVASSPQPAAISANNNNFVKVEQGFSDNLGTGLPLFFATAVYAFEGIGVVLPVVKEMQHPSRISGPSGVLNTSMSLVALLYMAMGFFGYAKYGQQVAGSITLNLPETTLNELVRLTFAIAIGLSYSLQFYVPWTIVWPVIDESLFYSYRPRQARDKLDVISKLSAENEWALGEAIEQHKRELQSISNSMATSTLDVYNQPSSAAAAAGTTTPTTASARRRQFGATPTPRGAIDDSTSTIATQPGADGELATQSSIWLHPNHEHLMESNASTLASSYSVSVASNFQHRQGGGPIGAASGSGNKWPFKSAGYNYGSIQAQQQQLQHMQQLHCQSIKAQAALLAAAGGANGGKQRRLRNRLEELIESPGDEPPMPEVQWRPPPRSMRGKRKLVRYTIILVTVSFTFVAAALIPRLDLFISLIGALASSSLAIIFPAIIQLCAFWNYDTDDDQDDDHDHNHDHDHDHDHANHEHCNRHHDDAAAGHLEADRRPQTDNQHNQNNQDDGAARNKSDGANDNANTNENDTQQEPPSSATTTKSHSKYSLPTHEYHFTSYRRNNLSAPPINGGAKVGACAANWRHLKRRIVWSLFVAKNVLLVVFGILGLITGSWISLSQLQMSTPTA